MMITQYKVSHKYCPFLNITAISGFKINWQKLALLPLNQAMCNTPVPTFIPFTKNFTYLGIEISSSIQTIIKQNFCNLLNKITADLDKWSNQPNSLHSWISTVKMNILPGVNFVSSIFFTPVAPILDQIIISKNKNSYGEANDHASSSSQCNKRCRPVVCLSQTSNFTNGSSHLDLY